MTPDIQMTLVALAIGVVAFLYSSVGHGGASGYIAVMTLAGFVDKQIPAIALVLNILVSSIGAFQFWKAGHFSWKLFWPFAILAIPLAYQGGAQNLPTATLKQLLGLVLFASAARLFIVPSDPTETNPPRRGVALSVGAVIGLLSGLTGTGGGIFLTPLMLICRWAKSREAAAVSAFFVLTVSCAGLAGRVARKEPIPVIAVGLAVSAVVGGTLGSRLGSTRLSPRWIHILLATALIVAGIKLLIIVKPKEPLPQLPKSSVTAEVGPSSR